MMNLPSMMKMIMILVRPCSRPTMCNQDLFSETFARNNDENDNH